MPNYKICHLTSAHSRYDVRIFLKECVSLYNTGYDESLIVADGLGNGINNAIKIFDVGKLPGRFNRMFKTTKLILNKAIELNSDIYHLHDPELIPIGLNLKKKGKIVIFDAHEDLPMQTLSKFYLGKWQRKILSLILKIYEKYTCKKFDAIVAATQSIKDKFININPNTINVNNFPIISEFTNENWDDKKREVCYIGCISETRGIKELIKAIEYINGIRLNLAGEFSEKYVQSEVKTYDGWNKVNDHGFVNRDQVKKILNASMAGIVNFLPFPNHINAQPNKIFEYMAAGIPVIASNFHLWKEIIERNKCGICVDPLNPKEIANAVHWIICHPKEAEEMGKNGRKAVEREYNWMNEEEKLFELYRQLSAKVKMGIS